MKAKLIYLISLCFVVSLAGHVQAVDWTDGGSDSLWSNPDNWTEWPMTTGSWAKIVNGENGATLASDGLVCQKMHIGGGLTFTAVDGAGLTMPQDLTVGRSGEATMDMQGGTINVGRDFEIGRQNDASVIMTGGTLNITRDLEIPKTDQTHKAHFDLHGGTLNLTRELRMNYKDPAVANGTMDITAGVLITAAGDGDETSRIQGYIDNGWITAYQGNGTIQMDYDVTNEGQTTVTALHKSNPIPADGGITAPGTTTLEWSVDAGTPVDVWFGNSPDWTTWEQLVDKRTITSVSVPTEAKQRYYWGVDTYAPNAEDPNYGPIFSFLADNIPPAVGAGDDVLTWLDNGSVEVLLSGTVTDVDATTTLWTVVSQPDSADAVLADSAAGDTTITLSTLGEYVLQLQADDGEYQDTDTLTINVYSDQCAAAQSVTGYQPLGGDVNLDCVVDQADLDILLEQWLNCNALDCGN
jgi:hypothetical protein